LVAALAFIKDADDRNNNMQYLECLSAALSDMAHTYQPAERMSVVLRAVMVELRGGNESNHFRLYKPKSAVVPARRGSTIDMDDGENMSQAWKKRQTGRPRAGTGASMRKPRTSSTSTTMSMSVDSHQGFSIKPSHPLKFDDPDRMDGFIMVTPRSEMGAWPSLSETPELSHALSTPTTTSVLSCSNPRHSGAWMGAEFDTSDSISQLANVHFPEMGAFDGETDGVESMTNLDFMNLGEGGDWGMGKDWTGGMGVGSDLDGFPPQTAFSGGGFESGEKFDV
jgi:hypothetical protein